MTSIVVYELNHFRNDPEYKDIKFNQIDRKYNCDRQSHHKPYEFVLYKEDQPFLVPCNPVGRTGLIGRGHLGRWGPNHAAGLLIFLVYRI